MNFDVWRQLSLNIKKIKLLYCYFSDNLNIKIITIICGKNTNNKNKKRNIKYKRNTIESGTKNVDN